MEVIELALHLILGHDGGEELHGVDAINDITILLAVKEHLDLGHGELAIGALGGVEDDTDASVVEHDDGLHHADRLPEGAVVIVVREGVLL